MCAGRVEVAQKRGVPLVAALALLLCIVALRSDVIGDDLLVEELCLAVRICGAQRAVLRDGDHVLEAGGVAVDGGGRGEDDVRDVVLGHGSEKANCAVDVDAVVLEGDLSRLADSLGKRSALAGDEGAMGVRSSP